MVGVAIEYAKLTYGIDLNDASPIKAIGKIGTPVLLIHGLKDNETPPDESMSLARRDRGATLWLVPGTHHVGSFSADPRAFRKRVLGWFAEHAN